MPSQLAESATTSGSTRAPQARRERKPLRVCMLGYAFYESDTRILQYATALQQRGDIVDVVALKRNDPQPDFEIINGVNVYRIQSGTVNEKGLFTDRSEERRVGGGCGWWWS